MRVKDSRFLKGLTLATWLYSLLFWVYVTARIIFTTTVKVLPYDPFIKGVPYLTFFSLGIGMFCLSFVSLVAYVAIWGK